MAQSTMMARMKSQNSTCCSPNCSLNGGLLKIKKRCVIVFIFHGSITEAGVEEIGNLDGLIGARSGLLLVDLKKKMAKKIPPPVAAAKES